MEKQNMIDYAKKDSRESWFRDSVLGDISFDNFKRKKVNPIYVGNEKDGYLWPVNLFLFKDPKSKFLYCYIGCYGFHGKCYGPVGPCRLMRSKDGEKNWEDLGIVLKGNKNTFDGNGKEQGGTPEGGIAYHNGLYHFIYDWCINSGGLTPGGIAYAKSNSPEGPFERDLKPIHLNTEQKPILGIYQRVYACTLIKRKSDWLILTISDCTTGNEGCSWAFVCMTAQKPNGLYSEPKLLLYPQSKYFHPVHVECYPAFVYQGYVYAPFTSVALNRNYQVIFRSKIEEAHLPKAWQIYQEGSVWHSEPLENETYGLWGQCFSGQITERKFIVGFPSKNSENIGTINIAERPWNFPYKDGGILSAPNGSAITFIKKSFNYFNLKSKIRSNKNVKIFWSYRGPLGANSLSSDATLHSKVMTNLTILELETYSWKLARIDIDGKKVIISQNDDMNIPMGVSYPVLIDIAVKREKTEILVNQKNIWAGKLPVSTGNIGLLAEKGAVYYVDKFEIFGKEKATTKFFLPEEGIRGAGNIKRIHNWELVDDNDFKFSFGYLNNRKEAMAKWNYLGKGFKLYCPRRPEFGSFDLFLDGKLIGTVNPKGRKTKSHVIFSKLDIPYGYHAIVQINRSKIMPCDTLEYTL